MEKKQNTNKQKLSSYEETEVIKTYTDCPEGYSLVICVVASLQVSVDTDARGHSRITTTRGKAGGMLETVFRKYHEMYLWAVSPLLLFKES